MSSVNKVILIGRLGSDPEVKTLNGGKSLAKLNLATNSAWRDRESGENREHTEWHRVVVWGKPAENVGQFLAKGSQVCIEGRIQTRAWTTKEGEERKSTEVVASQVTFLGSPRAKAA